MLTLLDIIAMESLSEAEESRLLTVAGYNPCDAGAVFDLAEAKSDLKTQEIPYVLGLTLLIRDEVINAEYIIRYTDDDYTLLPSVGIYLDAIINYIYDTSDSKIEVKIKAEATKHDKNIDSILFGIDTAIEVLKHEYTRA